mgnify:CR=1 FL=1
MPLIRDYKSESKIRREEIEEALRRQGVLTEPLVHWLASLDMMVADLMDRITALERAAAKGEGE